MSTPTIERVDEEMEEEEVEMKNNDVVENEVNNAEQSSAETHTEPPAEPTTKPPAIPEYASKAVKKLNKDERQKLLDGFEQGTEDPYFKVIRMKNGAIRITKRAIPLLKDVQQAVQANSERVEKKVLKHAAGSRLTNEQLLMEHIMDLETKFEAMRLKHKKLKRRYNDLESAIYDDADEVGAKPVETVSEPVEETVVEQVSEQVETPVEAPRTTTYERTGTAQRRQRMSWRDAISYMK